MKHLEKPWWVFMLIGCLAFSAMADEHNGPDQGCGIEAWQTSGGTLAFEANGQTLQELGLTMTVLSQTDIIDQAPELKSVFAAIDVLGLRLISYDGIFRALDKGHIDTIGELSFTSTNGLVTRIGDLRIEEGPADGNTRWVIRDRMHDNGIVFELMSGGGVQLDATGKRFGWNGLEAYLSDSFATTLGVQSDNNLGVFTYRGSIVPSTIETAVSGHDHEPLPSRGTIGPDVIVGQVYDYQRSTVGSQSAYSFGTESCNLGDETLDWISNNNRHPVIGQTIYRWDGTKLPSFKQLSQGWLKHGFCALSLTLCGPCTSGTGCEALGIGCSDPYGAGLNGQQSNLGPRYQVNATNGVFNYPPANPAWSGSLARRNIVANSDISPSSNPGAEYFVEAHYITQDDAQSGNGNNNASYREINFTSSLNVQYVGTTKRTEPAIYAWAVEDPSVTIVEAEVAGDGRYLIGSKVNDNGNGTWTYEYCIYNQNSDASAQDFEVPVPAGINVTDAGFYNVEYHSGEPYTNADWTYERLSNKVRWYGQTQAQNSNANALRWGTMYSFWFTADSAPKPDALASCDQFKQAVNFKFEVSAPDLPTNPFLVTIDLTSTMSSVAQGDRFESTASVMSPAGMATTDVHFTFEGFFPNGDPYPNNPIIDRIKAIPASINKSRDLSNRIANDAPLGTHTFVLTAERVSDGASETVSVDVEVTN